MNHRIEYFTALPFFQGYVKKLNRAEPWVNIFFSKDQISQIEKQYKSSN